MRTLLSTTIRFFVLISLSHAAFAQFTVASASADERNSDIAYNPTMGNYQIVWQKSGGEGSGGIYGEIRNPKGELVINNFPILLNYTSAGFSYSYTDPAVFFKAPNICLVVAKELESKNGEARIVAIKIGYPMSAKIALSDWSPASYYLEGRPDVAADTATVSDGYFLAVWPTGAGLVGRRIKADDGTLPEKSPFLIAGGEVGRYPAVAYEPRIGTFLTVCAYKMAPGEPEININLVGRNGAAWGSPFEISEPQNRPGSFGVSLDVAYNDACQRYLVVWKDKDGHIIGQRLHYYGSRDDDNFVINRRPFLLGIYGSTGHPAVAADTDTGNFLVTFYEKAPRTFIFSDTASDLYGKVVAGMTGEIGSKITILNDLGENDWLPAVAYGSEVFMVAWEHQSATGSSNYDIYGRVVEASGGK